MHLSKRPMKRRSVGGHVFEQVYALFTQEYALPFRCFYVDLLVDCGLCSQSCVQFRHRQNSFMSAANLSSECWTPRS